MGLFSAIKTSFANSAAEREEIRESILNVSTDNDSCFEEGVRKFLSYRKSSINKARGCLDAISRLSQHVSDRTLTETYDYRCNSDTMFLNAIIQRELLNRGMLERDDEGVIHKKW